MCLAWCALQLPCRWGVAVQILSIIPHCHSEVVLHILIWEHTCSFILPTPPGTVCTSSLSFATPDYSLLPWCEAEDKLLLSSLHRFWVVGISQALEPVSISSILLTQRCGEMINALLSRVHSFPDVSIITSYHFNKAIRHSDGNCPSVNVHLSPFLNIRI